MEIVEGDQSVLEGWKARVESAEEVGEKWRRLNRGQEEPAEHLPRVALYQPRFAGVFQGYLGESTRYNEPVWSMMVVNGTA